MPGRLSRYLALASFAVLSAYSPLVPPMTMARWYGGHAEVPISRSFSSSHSIIRAGFSSALVSWYRYDLLALPPPLAMNRNEYVSPPTAAILISAGRFVPVFASSYIVRGAIWL